MGLFILVYVYYTYLLYMDAIGRHSENSYKKKIELVKKKFLF